MKLDKWIESVPNFSEGRDLKKVERIVDSFRAKPGVKLLDYSTDPDHNRCVVTVLGQPEPLKRAMVEAIGTAVELIDMTRHEGQHPRIGCVDPFIPVRDCTIQEADQLAREIAQEAALLYGQPFYLYEKSATAPHRVDLANIRKGQFEGLAEKMKDPLWKPDFGPDTIHPTGGATAIGARMPLICFNINLDTPNVEIARQIARRVRNIGGGLHYVKAMGIALEQRNLAQLTMNLTDYTKSSIYSVFEMVKMEARRYGVRVVGSEVVGIVPMKALLDRLVYGMNKYYGERRGPSLWKGKALALLETCGYPPDKGCDLLEEGIRRYCRHSGLRYLGSHAERHESYAIPFVNAEKEQRTRAFALRLLDALRGCEPAAADSEKKSGSDCPLPKGNDKV